MKKILVAAVSLLAALSGRAQEKVMNIQMADGTTAQTRVADLKQISFLTVEEGGQGLLVKTLGGETVPVLFEVNPVVTISGGKLIIKSASTENIEVEISDISELLFGEAPDEDGIHQIKGFSYLLQDGGTLLRGIPKGVKPCIYSLDGRSIPTPPIHGDELILNRTTLGSGIFILKVGTFTTKISL